MMIAMRRVRSGISITNTNFRLGLGVGKIKNDIQKSRLRRFGHVMQMTEVRLLRKRYTQNWRENDEENDQMHRE